MGYASDLGYQAKLTSCEGGRTRERHIFLPCLCWDENEREF